MAPNSGIIGGGVQRGNRELRVRVRVVRCGLRGVGQARDVVVDAAVPRGRLRVLVLRDNLHPPRTAVDAG